MRRQDENDEVIDVITENAKVRPDIITNTILADISRSLAVIADSMRPTGHWKITYQGDVPAFCECSECGKLKVYLKVYDDYKYCPYCGAKMAESEEEK